MQFNLNGFRSGDPDLQPISARGSERLSQTALPAQTDVLIVGCGPAGLTLAAQLAAFPDIDLCIVDRDPGPLALGRADGVACRTVEMFQAFGFAERVLREAYWVNETTFWRTDDDAARGIFRSGRVDDTEAGLSEFPHVILNQARLHEFFLDIMRKSANRIEPWYGRKLVELSTDPGSPMPVTARFVTTLTDGSVREETIRARYAVGCDGARSAVRASLGLTLEGDAANQAWGVMDLLLRTDFPDIRLKSIITSSSGGAVVLIPREGGYLARFYVEMDKLGEDERAASRNLTVGDIVAAANKVLKPFTLDIKEVSWWSVYEIGQRMSKRFDDVADERVEAAIPCVFIAGDACHTHSPKAGQGMNVSMQDAFNLAWKLAAVLRGQSAPSLLRTYSQERHAVAKQLIEFDREWSAMLSAASKNDPAFAIDPATVQSYFVTHGRYTAGVATRYSRSPLTGSDTFQALASGFPVGMRFHSAPVIRLADARPMELGHTVKADGRWRMFAFAPQGSTAFTLSAVVQLCRYLSDNERSPINRYTPAGADSDSVIDLRCIVPIYHRDIQPDMFHSLLVPTKGVLEIQDYEKIFCTDPLPGKDIYVSRGIDHERGCIVIVRPDQYISAVIGFENYPAIEEFFDNVCLPCNDRNESAKPTHREIAQAM